MNALFEFLFHSEPTNSSTWELTQQDWKKTGRLLIVVALGGVITAVADYISLHLAGWEFGPYKPFIVPLVTMLLEMARRWVTNHQVQ